MAIWNNDLNRYVRQVDLADMLHASAEQDGSTDASVTGDWFDTSELTSLDLFLDLTVVTGATKTLDVKIQTRSTNIDASDTATDVVSFTQLTAVGSAHKRVTGLGNECRFVATVNAATVATWALTGVGK